MAVLLYFRLHAPRVIEIGPFEYRDKIPLKRNLEAQGIRLVPPGAVRYGAFLEPGVVVMPAYVNVGAYVGAGTMVDTWATVGSCAQVGRNVHISGGGSAASGAGPERPGHRGRAPRIPIDHRRRARGAGAVRGQVVIASTPIVDVRVRIP
jgi:2,3,4,5-tetrahydropyridine-2-carboxylate N-succinyltransferase